MYTYDFIMQSTYFNIKNITLEGNNRINKKEIINFSRINNSHNTLSINLHVVQKRLVHHPWIKAAFIKRDLPSGLTIKIVEEVPFAIVKIQNIAEIVINNQGKPFKELEPDIDNLNHLPVIQGLELAESKGDFNFKGNLLNLALKVLDMNRFGKIYHVKADKNMGISIKTKLYNKDITMKLGFSNFHNKAYKAEQIANYFKKNLINREISTFDLYDPENVLVKSKDKDALHNLTKGGV